MNAADTTLQTLRAEVVSIVMGTIFMSIGATACAIAVIRWRSGARVLVWLGVWSGLFGLQELIQSRFLIAALPTLLQLAAPYAQVAVMYLLLVSALFAWRELSTGKLKLLMLIGIIAGLGIATAGIINFLLGGGRDQWIIYNHLLAVLAAALLLVVVLVPGLARQLVITNSRLFTASTLIFAIVVAYTNLSNVFQYRVLPVVASISFAVFLFALGYVALEFLFTNERRLLAIDTELARARQIQSSILPTSVPELTNLRIAPRYLPMTSVAGDFYQFVRRDDEHLGILIADVSGHGIPAALISSMIKVAMQSVAIHADEPSQVLGGLNRILSSEAPGHLVSAAYIWIDSERRMALYSAAGHPPLLCWQHATGQLQQIESNGLLLGVLPECSYPACEVPLHSSDRFLLYTDGVTETENAAGEAFGDSQLEQIARTSRTLPACGLADQVLSAVQRWRAPSMAQQDDITLIVVDVL